MDESTLVDVIERMRPMMVAVARRRLGERGEDIVQEVCLAAWRCRDEMEDGELGPYLRTALSNRIKNEYRDAGRRGDILEPWPENEEGEQASLADPRNEDPEDSFYTEQVRQWVRDGIMRLDEPYRGTMQAFYLQGYNSREIAERDNRSQSAITNRLERGRRKLRKHLQESYDAFVT